MRYKGFGIVKNIKIGRGKIKFIKVQTDSILRLTNTTLEVNRFITPSVFGGHFTDQNSQINGNYIT